MSDAETILYSGRELAGYGFGDGHPFGPDRHDVFMAEVRRRGLDRQVAHREPVMGTAEQAALFHEREYVDFVRTRSEAGTGYLDAGDTPAMPGIYEAALTVVGSAVAATDAIMAGECRRAFVPIAGLHHAAREGASGFCVFNDCGVVIEHLKQHHGLSRIAYVDIDAHHGDGVQYGFESDPACIFADIHEDGRFLFPGTGHAHETGKGEAEGTKLNIPLPPGAGDEAFDEAWPRVLEFLDYHKPEFILLQCGADSLEGDPITHLRYSDRPHREATRSLMKVAELDAGGRLLATGGGGYNRPNIARAWTAVLEEMVRR